MTHGLGTVGEIRSRANDALGVKELWRSYLQDAYEYLMPQREVWSHYSPGYRKTDKIFDSTGQIAIKEFANRMMGAITPQGTVWAELEPGLNYSKEERQDTEVLRILSEINEVLFNYINNSNFYTVMGEAYLDLALGTAGITVDEGDQDNPLVFGLVNQAEVGYEAGPNGLIENIYRKMKRKARNVLRNYPGIKMTPDLKNAIENNPDSDIEFLECVMFNPKTKLYWLVVIFNEEEVWSVNRGSAAPWIAFRWSVIPGEVRGRGPALDALQDVKTLNKVEQFALQKAALDLSGLWTGQDDGLFNPYTAQIAPGVIIPVSTNQSTNPSLQRLDTGAPLNLTQFEVQRMQTAIRTHLFNDLRDPTGPVRSATEVAINQRELANRIGASFGRIQNEALTKILNSSVSILQRLGIVPPFQIDGADIAVKFTSPLSRAQDMEDLETLQRTVGMTAQLAGPEMVASGFKLDQFPTYIATKTGVDPELVRSDEEKMAMMRQMAEMAQQQMQGGENAEPPIQ